MIVNGQFYLVVTFSLFVTYLVQLQHQALSLITPKSPNQTIFVCLSVSVIVSGQWSRDPLPSVIHRLLLVYCLINVSRPNTLTGKQTLEAKVTCILA